MPSLLRYSWATFPCALLAVLIAWLLAAGTAHADSSLLVPVPSVFGEIGAATYDEAGERVGPAGMRILRLDDGRVRIEANSGIEDAERTAVVAELTPSDDGSALRPLFQESRSFDASGAALGVMRIDHEAGVGSCLDSSEPSLEPDELALPRNERVANVFLNLLFQPLARGESRAVDFQIFVCRGGPRIMSGEASVEGPPRAGGDSEGLVQIRYGVDLGPLFSRLARPFLPRLTSWFDPTSPDAWVGQRMPLFSNGPTVLIVRSGFSAKKLTSP